jgi:SAM-dependent methyltransferase
VSETIRTLDQRHCLVCGSTGGEIHVGLRDKIFGVPGEWRMRRCYARDCGALWLNPMPTPDDIGKAYVNYYTHTENAQPPESESFSPAQSFYWRAYWNVLDGYLQTRYHYSRGVGARWHRLLAPLGLLFAGGLAALDHEASYLPAPRPGGRLLEVGCGDGSQLARKRELGWVVEGLDFDAKAVEAARRRGLTVHAGDLASRRYPPGAFDAMYLTHTFEHVPDPRALAIEAARVLAPGGFLVIQTPNAASWGHSIFQTAWRGLEPPRHLTLHTRGSLRRVAADAGLEVQRLMTTPRLAKFMWRRSLELAPRRLRNIRRVSPRIASQLFEVVERCALPLLPDAGEELVLVARKRLAAWPARESYDSLRSRARA